VHDALYGVHIDDKESTFSYNLGDFSGVFHFDVRPTGLLVFFIIKSRHLFRVLTLAWPMPERMLRRGCA
jgi:hypothetical protein